MKPYLLLALLLPGMTLANDSSQVLVQPNMSLALAKQLATEVQARCTGFGKPVAVTVVDRAGQVVLAERGDDVGPHNLDASRLKAFTALSTRTLTSEFAERVKSTPTMAALANVPGLLLIGGGLPIRAGDQVIGAVGVAGSGSPERDEECITGRPAPTPSAPKLQTTPKSRPQGKQSGAKGAIVPPFMPKD